MDTVKPKSRKRVAPQEGDLIEVSAVEGPILSSPKARVDRNAVADRIEALFANFEPLPEDVGRSEEEIMQEIIDDIAEARRERREAECEGRS